MKKRPKVFISLLIIIAASIIVFFFTNSRHDVPVGAYKKVGAVTRLSPNCKATTYIQNGEMIEEDGPILCDGGSFITVDDLIIQYETGLTLEGDFFYDLGDVNVGDNVTAIYVQNGNLAQINCDGCGVFK